MRKRVSQPDVSQPVPGRPRPLGYGSGLAPGVTPANSNTRISAAALPLLGARLRGGLLVSGAAVFALAYAIGSAAGSGSTGLTMDLVSVDAGPVFVGLLMLGFTGFFALNLMRIRASKG